MRKYLILLFPLFVWSQVDKNGDFQIWNRDFMQNHITKDLSVLSEVEFRWGNDASKFYYTNLQSQLIYFPNNWFGCAAGYRQTWTLDPVTSSHWEPSYVPLADLIFILRMNHWAFRDRNRVEYVIFRSDPNHWIYRNRLRIIAPWTFTRARINPFISEEVFFRQGAGFFQNRLACGFFYLITCELGGESFYTYRLLKQGDKWTYQNVLNLTLFLDF